MPTSEEEVVGGGAASLEAAHSSPPGASSSSSASSASSLKAPASDQESFGFVLVPDDEDLIPDVIAEQKVPEVAPEPASIDPASALQRAEGQHSHSTADTSASQQGLESSISSTAAAEEDGARAPDIPLLHPEERQLPTDVISRVHLEEMQQRRLARPALCKMAVCRPNSPLR